MPSKVCCFCTMPLSFLYRYHTRSNLFLTYATQFFARTDLFREKPELWAEDVPQNEVEYKTGFYRGIWIQDFGCFAILAVVR